MQNFLTSFISKDLIYYLTLYAKNVFKLFILNYFFLLFLKIW